MKKLLSIVGAFVFALALATPAMAFDIVMGNPATDRAVVDTYHNFSIVDTNNSAGYDGVITEIQYYAKNTNPFKFLIVDETRQVEWKSDLITLSGVGMFTYTLPSPVEVHPGWNIGMYFQSTGTIPFDYDGTADPAYYEGNNAGKPAIGEILTVAGTTRRYYSLLANGWSYGAWDPDNDGVSYSTDLCPGTTADGSWESDKGWGTNRWQVMDMDNAGTLGWFQNKPKVGATAGFGTDLDYTYGCNGHQILELLSPIKGAMEGHWKYGLSTSVVEDFHLDYQDGIIDGRYFVERVTVPANKSTNTYSVNPLASGVSYILKASGTANAGDGIVFDARYSFRTPTSTEWTDAVSTYESYGVTLLDLLYDGSTLWGDYNSSHEYEANVIGAGIIAPFRIHDIYYPNNTGNLLVDIYAEL